MRVQTSAVLCNRPHHHNRRCQLHVRPRRFYPRRYRGMSELPLCGVRRPLTPAQRDRLRCLLSGKTAQLTPAQRYHLQSLLDYVPYRRPALRMTRSVTSTSVFERLQGEMVMIPREALIAPSEALSDFALLGSDNLTRLIAEWSKVAWLMRRNIYFAYNTRQWSAPIRAQLIRIEQTKLYTICYYLNLLKDAKRRTTATLPLIPIFRPGDWCIGRGTDVVCLFQLDDHTSFETSSADQHAFVATHGYVNGEKTTSREYLLVRCEISPGYYPDGDFVFDIHTPCIMTTAEFRHFKQHPDQLKVWLAATKPTGNYANIAEAIQQSGST